MSHAIVVEGLKADIPAHHPRAQPIPRPAIASASTRYTKPSSMSFQHSPYAESNEASAGRCGPKPETADPNAELVSKQNFSCTRKSQLSRDACTQFSRQEANCVVPFLGNFLVKWGFRYRRTSPPPRLLDPEIVPF